ncbi:MAG: transposase [Clostridia bacterium]|nr:transposase [Clostridia bacterium]
MARSARKISENGLYHAVLRSVDGRSMFYENEDYEKFIQVLGECKKTSEFLLFAYSLSPDMVHIIIKTGDTPLSMIFKRINTKYIYWYKRKYGCTGKLLRDRYKSEPLDTVERLAGAVKYVHSVPGAACTSLDEYKNGGSRIDADVIYRTVTKAELLNADEPVNAEDYIGENNYAKKGLSDDEVKKILSMDYACNSTEDVLILSEDFREIIIKRLHSAGASIRQISRLTGIGKSTVERKLR